MKPTPRRHARHTASAAITILVLFGFQAALAAPVRVVAEGKAAGSGPNVRELALADALRDAVRKGAGVDVLSATRATDFVLDYDRVLASSFGYVREYNVLEAGLGADEIYRVKIRATVDEGQPEMRDRLALRLIVRRKGSPRVSLEIDELIEGVPAGADYARGWFEQAAQQMQLQLVDTKRTGRQDDKLAARDAFFGDERTSGLRKLDISQESDFIIEARVRGHALPRQTVYDVAVTPFAFSVDLRALRPDTGTPVASVALPSIEASSTLQSTNAAREVLHKVLAGELGGQEASAWKLFRKMFAAWVTELDLGTLMRLEFRQIASEEFDAVQAHLADAAKITSVWPREFDSRGLSYIDVETRLDAPALKSVVLEAIGTDFALDRYTRNYLQFVRSP